MGAAMFKTTGEAYNHMDLLDGRAFMARRYDLSTRIDYLKYSLFLFKTITLEECYRLVSEIEEELSETARTQR